MKSYICRDVLGQRQWELPVPRQQRERSLINCCRMPEPGLPSMVVRSETEQM